MFPQDHFLAHVTLSAHLTLKIGGKRGSAAREATMWDAYIPNQSANRSPSCSASDSASCYVPGKAEEEEIIGPLPLTWETRLGSGLQALP